MIRPDIRDTIGEKYFTYSVGKSEQNEFHYDYEFKVKGKDWDSIKIKKSFNKGDSFYKQLDMRFVDDNRKLAICVETKLDYKKDFKKAKEQLNAYMQYEKIYSGYTVVGILANTDYNDALFYKDSVSDDNKLPYTEIVSFDTLYKYLFPEKENNKESVMKATYKLNNMLQVFDIDAKIRSQFVGTCLLALKNNLNYEVIKMDSNGDVIKDKNGKPVYYPIPTYVVIAGIKSILGSLLEGSMNRADKLSLLSRDVLENDKVKNLSDDKLHEILCYIRNNILPFINDETTVGQDILSLFFTTFNKYVDKDDKNQAFTPDHITEFMCRLTGVNKDSRVLDPCCGSGSFLVRALVTARNDCTFEPNKDELVDRINKSQIYGIEYSAKPYGLSTTNMLIHGDGNTNIIKANCFDEKEWIKNIVKPTVILMNPPYNAQYVNFPENVVDYIGKKKDKKGQEKEIKVLKTYCSDAWPKQKGGKPTGTDPTKGLCFVDYISDCLKEANIVGTKLAVLVPLASAQGKTGLLLRTKENLLKYNTLEAVFTMPPDLFYPGANANVCCMLFTMGVPHCNAEGKPHKKTFFGYYKEDGFKKKRNLGRIEQENENGESIWKTEIEPKWLSLYLEKEVEPGLSAKEYVSAKDEWLCEAYMTSDYNVLSESDFQYTLNNYLAYLLREGYIYEA